MSGSADAQQHASLEHKLMWEGSVPAKGVKPIAPLDAARIGLVAFKASPFPYHGLIPGTERPFLDLADAGRRGRLHAHGAVHWEAETYSDRRALLHLPRGFTPSRPAAIVVFLHGNKATLERDVWRRQRVPEQVAISGANVALVAPQLAVDAADSSAGRFWEPGFLASFLDEAAHALARLHGTRRSERLFRHLPVVIVAYSGGYQPAAWALHHGGATERVVGVVVLDGIYGEQAKFAEWIRNKRRGVFVSAFTASSRDGNAALRRQVEAAGIGVAEGTGPVLDPGTVAFIATAPEVTHQDFVTRAWVDDPLADVLSRLPYRRGRAR